jgi:signal transduction histidine kinase
MDRTELTAFLGHVSSSVGHQVINSLSTIVSQTEILRTLVTSTEADGAEIVERIETIIRVSLDASTLTRRLLELSHDLTSIEPLDPASTIEEIDLSALAAEFAKGAETALVPGTKLMLDLAPITRIRGNPATLARGLALLLDNAVESLPETGGEITIATRPGPRDWVSLEIRDTGRGMSPELVERAAEPFFSTKPGRRGLGLTIARGIWRRHRGGLVIESQPGAGTTIRLITPPSTST